MDPSAIAASAQALSNILIQRGISIGQQVQHQRASESSTVHQAVSSGVPPRVSQAQSQPVYSYKVKIINPHKKSEVIVRQLNKFTSKFESVLDIRLKLIDECSEHVPNTVDYNVGFYEGSKQTKVWIVTDADLQTMYRKHPNGGNVTLWSDGKQSNTTSPSSTNKRKRDSETPTARDEKESEVETIFKELEENHHGRYDTSRLRLWSRMIVAGIHHDYEDPPDIPAFNFLPLMEV